MKKINKISIQDIDEDIIEYKISDIKRIEFHGDYIRINDEVLERDMFYYPHWRYLIKQLITFFDVKEFEIEGGE